MSRVLALASLFSPPDEYLLRHSHTTLIVCEHQGGEALIVIDAKSILSVIAAVPFPFVVGGRNNQYYMVEKIGLDILEADVDVDDEE